MYNNKLAVAIKSAGKVLREFQDQVYVPFNSEYSILIKNLNSTRALVRVMVDETEVCSDGLVINPNSSLELERFVKNLDKGNRFKFIERTGKIEDTRGIKIEDGLIRVEFQFEKVVEKVTHEVHHEYIHHYDRYWWDDWYWWDNRHWRRDPPPPYRVTYRSDCGGYGSGIASSGSSGLVGSSSGSVVRSLMNSGDGSVAVNLCNASGAGSAGNVMSTPTMDSMDISNEAGITVPGSISNQQFTTVSDFEVEDTKHVMVIKLLGETGKGKKVRTPVTVKSKQKCVTCGHLNKATAKFCVECGTALEIV